MPEQVVPQNNKSNSTAPALGVMLALALLPLIRAGLDHWILDVLVTVLLLICLQQVWTGNLAISPSARPSVLFLGAFVLWCGLSMVWSLDPHRTLMELLQLLCYSLVFLFTLNLSEDNLYRAFRIALIAGFGVALFGISTYVVISSSRIDATMVNANPLGTYMGMMSFAAWGYYLRDGNKALFGLTALFLVGFILTGSRGAYVALGLALPFLGILVTHIGIKRAVVQTIMLATVVFLLSQGVTHLSALIQEKAPPSERVASVFVQPIRRGSIDSSSSGRLAFWRVAVERGLAQPLTGYGLGSFSQAYYLQPPADRWYSRWTHNHYLQTFAELGLLGVGILLGFLLLVSKAGFNVTMQSEQPTFVYGLLAALLMFLFHIGVEFSWNFPGVTVLFFFMAAVLVRLEDPPCRHRISRRWVVVPVVTLMLVSVHLAALAGFFYVGYLDATERPQEALRVTEIVTSFYPFNPRAFSLLSNQYVKMAHTTGDAYYQEQAFEALKRAVALTPTDASLQQALAHRYLQLGDHANAEKHFLLASNYAGHRLTMFVELGTFYLQRSQLVVAEEAFRRGLGFEDIVLASTFGRRYRDEVRHDLLLLNIGLGRSLYMQERYDEAYLYMVRAKELNPEFPAVITYFQMIAEDPPEGFSLDD